MELITSSDIARELGITPRAVLHWPLPWTFDSSRLKLVERNRFEAWLRISKPKHARRLKQAI